jgi:hypothetical protein
MRSATAVLAGALAVSVLGGVGSAEVNVHVTAVSAADRGPSDPALEPLRPRLRKLVGYNSFRIVGEEQRRCAWRSAEHFGLPGGRTLRLLPKGVEDQRFTMQVRLLDGRRRLVDTLVRLPNRGTMAFGVGRDGRVADRALIILLKAEE